jgi:hypothetical protein
MEFGIPYEKFGDSFNESYLPASYKEKKEQEQKQKEEKEAKESAEKSAEPEAAASAEE